MSFRSQIPFLVAVFIVAIAGTFLAFNVLPRSGADAPPQLMTVVVYITNTVDPNATEAIRIITATPDRTQVNIPDNLVPTGDGVSALTISTPFSLTPNEEDVTTTSGLEVPTGCILHVVGDGDTVFGVADEYGVNPFLMLQVNGLDEDSAAALQIGDELIVPVDTCPVDSITLPPTGTPLPTDTPETTPEATEEDTEEATEDPQRTPTPRVTPTITLAPTAEDAVLEIVGIVDAGDVTAEGIRIRNPGSNSTVTVTGWTLEDLDGNVYEFRNEQRIFSNSEVTIFTRAGQDTPIALFWGLDEAVWQENDVVTLRDASGDVQAIFRVPADIDL